MERTYACRVVACNAERQDVCESSDVVENEVESNNSKWARKMRHVVKLLIVAEIQSDSERDAVVAEAHTKLDAFREATLPWENYGVTLYRATPNDLSRDLLKRQIEVKPLPE